MKNKIKKVLIRFLGLRFRAFVFDEMAKEIHSLYVEAYVKYRIANLPAGGFLTWMKEEHGS